MYETTNPALSRVQRQTCCRRIGLRRISTDYQNPPQFYFLSIMHSPSQLSSPQKSLRNSKTIFCYDGSLTNMLALQGNMSLLVSRGNDRQCIRFRGTDHLFSALPTATDIVITSLLLVITHALYRCVIPTTQLAALLQLARRWSQQQPQQQQLYTAAIREEIEYGKAVSIELAILCSC